jgi:hypothetical protein
MVKLPEIEETRGTGHRAGKPFQLGARWLHFLIAAIWRASTKSVEISAVAGSSLFSLKGWNKSAQGIALGPTRATGASPERAKQSLMATFVMPFQGEHSTKRPIPGRCPGLSCLAPLGQARGELMIG